MFKPPLYPTPPAKGASRLDRMLFLQKNYIYSMALVLPVLALGLVFSVTVLAVVGAAGLFLQALGLGILELQIRTERRSKS